MGEQRKCREGKGRRGWRENLSTYVKEIKKIIRKIKIYLFVLKNKLS